MRSIVVSIISICFCTVKLTYGQINFDTYRTLQSNGELPKDFSSNTFEKVSKELEIRRNDLSRSQKKEFFRGIHYGIDDILHSGLVVYGDEVSNYVNAIAQKLLANEPELLSKLNFYTLKSNESNAFSTNQGTIFVTVGLIARLGNEAQLAFILAHEISHYTEHHVINSFKFREEQRNKNIRSMSIYSKQNELDADEFGLMLYKDAGYDKGEIINALSVLNNTHLPFDEVSFPNDYFNTSELIVPDSLFTKTKFNITSFEDSDDSQSSHPNIKSRKEHLVKVIENTTNWGNEVNYFGSDKFSTIRNICRFENLRVDLLLTNYIDAIYSINILEKEFPNSTFLDRMKAQSFLGLYQLAVNGRLARIVRSDELLEGEVAPLHVMISKLSAQEVHAISLRQIHDLSEQRPNDEQIDAVYNFFAREISANVGNVADTLFPSNDNDYPSVGIKSIVTDPLFIARLESANESFSKSAVAQNDNNILVIEPQVICFKRNEIDLEKSEKLKRDLSEVISYSGNASSLDVSVIDRDNLRNSGTVAFNERNILFTYLFQMSTSGEMNRFLVDYDQLGDIKNKYNTSKIMLIHAEQQHNPAVLASFALLPAYPIAAVVIPIMLLKRNKTTLKMVIFDIDSNQLESNENYSFNEAPKKYNLGAHMYSIFEKLSSKQHNQ